MQKEIHYKLFCGMLALFLLFGCKTDVHAEAENTLRVDIEDATQMISDVMKQQLEEKKEELRYIIKNKDYDVNMTMESFYENGNPFDEVDYLKLIAWYASVKEECLKTDIPIYEGLCSVPLVKMEIKEKQLIETTPLIVKDYEEVEDGKYRCIGNREIKETETIGIYEKQEDGTYNKTGVQEVHPQEEKLVYGEISLAFTGYESFCSFFSVNAKKIEPKAETMYWKMKNEIDGRTLTQSVFIQMPKQISEDEKAIIHSLAELVNDEETRKILDTAFSLIGQVPYQWGGKPKKSGYDTSWWLYDEAGQQRGLDCSGYVQWVFMTCGYGKDITDQLVSTSAMQSLTDISKDELVPGDIGLLNHGESTNHTGIYLGNGYFIHCSSEKQTVTISQYPFRYFKRVLFHKNNVDKNGVLAYSLDKYTYSVINENKNTNSKEYTEKNEEKNKEPLLTLSFEEEHNKNQTETDEEEIYLLAQLIEHEAGNQGYNGMVAVGEVVLNRARSEKFDENTVTEVIYADGQFSNIENLKQIIPTEEELSIARLLIEEKISIFQNSEVLYFKNPKITDGISPDVQKDWGKHKWYASVNEHAFYLG